MKKKYMFVYICTALIISFLCVNLMSFFSLTSLTSAQVSLPENPVVVIDAGHGGEDGGATAGDVLEKDINLSIANATSDLFRIFGYDVVQTRIDDNDLSDAEETTRARKVADMKKRLEIFNSDTNNIVISIHQNKFTDSKYYGTQLFYSPNVSASKNLADNIRNSVVNLIQPENSRECKKADNSIYLLKNAKVPAVIVECGFISNPEECKKLIDNEYQKQLSYSIFMGFSEYKNSVYKE